MRAKRALRMYKINQSRVKGLQAEYEILQQELALYFSPDYRRETVRPPASGSSSTVEGELLKRQQMEQRLHELDLQIRMGQLDLRRVDNALELLAPIEAEILRRRFIDGQSIAAVAMALNFSESSVNKKTRQGLAMIEPLF